MDSYYFLSVLYTLNLIFKEVYEIATVNNAKLTHFSSDYTLSFYYKIYNNTVEA